MWKIKLLSWNGRGLGSLEKCKEVLSFVKEKRPSILCIQ